MLLDIPGSSVTCTLSFCSPSEWGRLRIVHKALQASDDDLLLESGIATTSSLPCLGDAARSGLLHIVLAHIRRGESPNVRDKEHPKYTPLHRSASGGHRSVVRLLLFHKANAIERDRLGFCALHFAANHSPGLVTDLIQAKCDVNATNLQGVTPLHSAAGMCRADICALLLDAGAQARKTRGGKTPAEMARTAGHRFGRHVNNFAELLDRLLAAEAVGAAETAGQRTWHFLADGELWIPFDAEIASAIDEAHLRGENEVLTSVDGRTYRIDLIRRLQTNVETGRERPVELRVRNAEISARCSNMR
eukprot:TRINITY_DN17389_c0_g1_i3.p1 TRINITY_DN17389_c0_g1~~TRINITY_DN17389_c0_g1_i3.p1  ORF type:complete len:305 (+),score=20.94 TRINITY_DN17389_c0_g1_i3:293-1207(+)